MGAAARAGRRPAGGLRRAAQSNQSANRQSLANDCEADFTVMAIQVRPTRSEPGPHTGLCGRVGDEANVGAFHPGSALSCSTSAAGYMCAILTPLARREESPLATGRSPYRCGAVSGYNQQSQLSQPHALGCAVSPFLSRPATPPPRAAPVCPLATGGLLCKSPA